MLDESAYLQLWQKLIKGDRKAFEKLFDALGKELVSYAYKISLDRALAKDAVQDVFVDLWLYRSNLNEDVQVKFYLYRCVRRATTKLLRRDNQENTEAQWYPMDFEADELSPEMLLCRIESESFQEAQIEKSLKILSEREREIITLKYYSNLKLREIANLLEIKEQTVANILQKALTKLRQQLSYLISIVLFFIFD